MNVTVTPRQNQSSFLDRQLTLAEFALSGGAAGAVPAESEARRAAPVPQVETLDNTETESEEVGLSTAHISPEADFDPLEGIEHPRLVVAVGGDLVKLHGPPTIFQPGGGPRSQISSFSAQSRRRLMSLIASIDKRNLALPLFITLTYPGKDEHWKHFTPQDWKRHLDNFFKAIARKFPEYSGIWKLEPQERGAPHYHIMVFNVPFIAAHWVAETWWRIVGSNDPDHLKAGTEVRRCRSWRNATAYVSKYLGKRTVNKFLVPYPGRYWGVRGADRLPREFVEVTLGLPQFHRVRRVLRRWLASRGYNRKYSMWQGIQAFMDWSVALHIIEWLHEDIDVQR